MPQEIERKFLVKSTPALADYERREIAQGYIEATGAAELRVRRIGGSYYLTSKSGSGIKREENEEAISRERFHALLEKKTGNLIEKTRYYIPSGKHVIELDIYEGALSGLVTAEVEFESVSASGEFSPPEWFGAEVTYDERYKNKNLALRGAPAD